MNSLVSTYKRDFSWPAFYSSGKGGKTADSYMLEAEREENLHLNPCHGLRVKRGETDKDGVKETNVDGTIAEARTGAPPAGETTKHGQPDAFLRQLQEKYPYIYNVLQFTTEEKLIERVHQEKLKSTYEADYGKQDNYEELMDVAETLNKKRETEEMDKTSKACSKTNQEPITCQQCGKDFEQSQEKKKIRLPKITDIPKSPFSKKSTGKDMALSKKAPSPSLKRAKSEYADTINKVGNLIISERLHYRDFQDTKFS